MNYKNISFYVQRQIDCLFRELLFVKAFIDDIIIYFKTMKEHVTYIIKIFVILSQNEISVNFKKTFIEYSSI
jgi:hypothetical protein